LLLLSVGVDRMQHIPYVATERQPRLRPWWGWSDIGSFVATFAGI